MAAAASQLTTFTEEDLIRGVDPSELNQADVYPGPWDDPDKLRWVAHHLADVQTFFTKAAKDGDAVICWLD